MLFLSEQGRTDAVRSSQVDWSNNALLVTQRSP